MTPKSDLSTPRRRFLVATTGFSISAVFPRRGHAAKPTATILETKVISKQPEYYHGWPTVVRRTNGELWLTWSGGRESHVCPFGQVQAMTSRDDGSTWSWPRVLFDSATDDRDSGVIETAKGTLLVTTFTSLAYEPHLEKRQIFSDWSPTGWGTKEMPTEQVAKWNAVHARLSDVERKAELGEWLIRSTDGGKSWSEPHPIGYGLPSHLLRLRDSQLLMSYGYRRTPYGNRARVSSDHGKSWSDELILSADGTSGDLGYPSTVELDDGTLLTVWYEAMSDQKFAVLRQAKWRLA